MGFAWSKMQEAVFREVEHGDGHLVVEALAGTAKTTTIVEALKHIGSGESCTFTAFNRAIADELKSRIETSKNMRVSTLHSMGFSAVLREFHKLDVEEAKERRMLIDAFPSVLGKLRTAACRATALCKANLIPNGAKDPRGEVDALLDRHWIADFDEKDRGTVIDMVLHLLDAGRDPRATGGSISFDDMCWLPAALNLSLFRSDRLFVDELQDLSPCQHWLVKNAVKKYGRFCGVGDRHQCIPRGQRVQTPGGYVAIENVQEGDLVLSVKAGKAVPQRVVRKTETFKREAFEFDLGSGRTFRATAEHTCFAALDSPGGSFVYLMYRPDMGFRIGTSRTAGHNGFNFVVRTQQEGGERLWVLEWRKSYQEAAEIEAHLAYRHQVPREPFRPRSSMWCDNNEKVHALFREFGCNGVSVLNEYKLDFARPNYFAKASSRGRVAVNLQIGTKDNHKVEVETQHAERSVAKNLGMLPTKRGTWRLRSYFPALRDAQQEAERVAAALGGYVVETLACSKANRRMLAVPATSVNVSMLVPWVGRSGVVEALPVIERRTVPAGRCFDLEVEDLGTFIVNGAVVHNSIYQFRGAASDSMQRAINHFHARTLPLSITYRCPKAVVAAVKDIVPDFEAAESAPEGLVADATNEKMYAEAEPGDFILSRVNAPLIKHCIELLRLQKRATILGRNIGKSIVSLIDKSEAKTAEELGHYVTEWCARETSRILARDPDADVGHLGDRRDCLLAVAEGLSAIEDVRKRAEALFDDGDPLDRVTLSSTHRAKGLERNRVWMLRGTYLRGNSEQERNLFYVAATRAKRELYFVKE